VLLRLLLAVALVAAPAAAAHRQGIVRLDRRAFADGGGPYLALGHSLFWARWGFVHDRARLERNLAFLASNGVDYIRVLGVVDWPDRYVGADAPDDSITGLTDLAFDKYGLRVEWSIFGAIDSTPTPEARERLVRRFAAALAPRREKLQAIELGNELWSTGWKDKAAEAQVLARLLRKSFDIVAVTSPQGLDAAAVGQWYSGSGATLLTVHPPRDGGSGRDAWRYVTRAWEPWQSSPMPWSNDEGKGPQSSVAADDDPLRLAMYAGLTWLGGGAAFTLHTGAGISGGGALAAPGGTHPFQRSANVWEVPNIERTLRAIRAVRDRLPRDLPNWTRDRKSDLMFAAHAEDGRFVTMPMQMTKPIRVVRDGRFRVDVYDPSSGARVESHTTPFTLAPRPALILIGAPQP
jgi:hypothetical protein